MDFKKWLNESRIEFFNGKSTFYIYKNPTHEELLQSMEDDKKLAMSSWRVRSLGEVRGFTDSADNVYVWPMSGTVHDDVAEEMRTDIKLGFYIGHDLKVRPFNAIEDIGKHLKLNLNYRRMMEVGDDDAEVPLWMMDQMKKMGRKAKFPTVTWKTALQPEKVKPGGLQKLPFEAVNR